MKFSVKKSDIKGTAEIPGSKSHTIRSLIFASLAKGKSRIIKPLFSDDTASALNACRAFGSKIVEEKDGYIVEGFDGSPALPDDVINVGNSGTTLRIALSTAALAEGYTVFTGDYQIRNRPLLPLLNALTNLGASTISVKNNGRAPVVIRGRAKGGHTELDAVSSQFLSSLLINCPLLGQDTAVELIRLNEVPYVDITLWWLDKLGIKYSNNSYKSFNIPGNQHYKAFNQTIPADFSSATFFIVLAAISGGRIELKNLDMTDPQGDKLVLKLIEEMGAEVVYTKDSIAVQGRKLKGIEIDMNSIPDALPAMAVAACFAEGETKLLNVPQARFKETDRIKVMHDELEKMGADIKELKDGLIIRQSALRPSAVSGHDDHRIVMALTIAGLNIKGETIIHSAEAAGVTFPNFAGLIKGCGGNIMEAE
jgi:3-phosphoshikimate 1-carboxyvinyltransferase